MTRNERFKERNKAIRQQFSRLSKDNPKWRIDALIETIANKNYLSTRTVEAIISHEGIYNESFIPPQKNQLELF
jgi:hypothetical protein